MVKPPKSRSLLDDVRKAVMEGSYRLTNHALQRMEVRKVVLTEVEYVLNNGYHEASKDDFNEQFQRWRYAIRGSTVDMRDLRIVVSFDGRMWIITVIDKDN